jgi:hypothetical protein
MGTRLIFLGQEDVTVRKDGHPLSDWDGGLADPGNSPPYDRTLNRHRWTGREYQGA